MQQFPRFEVVVAAGVDPQTGGVVLVGDGEVVGAGRGNHEGAPESDPEGAPPGWPPKNVLNAVSESCGKFNAPFSDAMAAGVVDRRRSRHQVIDALPRATVRVVDAQSRGHEQAALERKK